MHPLDSTLILPAAEGQKLTLGDRTMTLVNIPGHTPGALGVIVPVTHNGTPHVVMTFAATQMPTRASLEQFDHVLDEFARPSKRRSTFTRAASRMTSRCWKPSARTRQGRILTSTARSDSTGGRPS
jgi:hypothetical protein